VSFFFALSSFFRPFSFVSFCPLLLFLLSLLRLCSSVFLRRTFSFLSGPVVRPLYPFSLPFLSPFLSRFVLFFFLLSFMSDVLFFLSRFFSLSALVSYCPFSALPFVLCPLLSLFGFVFVFFCFVLSFLPFSSALSPCPFFLFFLLSFARSFPVSLFFFLWGRFLLSSFFSSLFLS